MKTFEKFLFAILCAGTVLQPLSVFATSHYSYENSDQERLSGKIHWREFGPEAFTEAVKDNKPIFLLLTAPSWCYWCHVYDSNDYLYNERVYPFIDRKFIPIYVDADQRQDLTRQYLEGGWPSTTIMTPSGQRIFGYSGPRSVDNMVINLQKAVDYVQQSGFSTAAASSYEKTAAAIPTGANLQSMIDSYQAAILGSFDSEYGGFGQGQKFPQGRTMDYALDLYEQTKDKKWLDIVTKTFESQYTKAEDVEITYRLFDPIEGGFHRYATQRDGTVPHYEKMLYDNARLLTAYAHLERLLPNDARIREMVTKTKQYMEQKWYDKEQGGFYGNTDVGEEKRYYMQRKRSQDKPRVETTKYTDWNSEAIITYLSLWKGSQKTGEKDIAGKSLDFLQRQMLTGEGMAHYEKEDGTRGVRGSLLDNTYALLAFTEGYDTLGDTQYLEAAQKVADYSLQNLYDWYGGGFFERNSPDTDLYAPGQHVLLAKPSEENGIMAYGFLRLYNATQNPVYLNAGLKTLGTLIGRAGGLDDAYYTVRSAELVRSDGLLSAFENLKTQIEQLEEENQQASWLNGFMPKPVSKAAIAPFQPSTEGVPATQAPFLLLVLVALLAGLLSFASPCCLPTLPAFAACIVGSSKQSVKGRTIAFVLGMGLTFTLLGMSASLVGSFLRSHLTGISQILGILIMLFGLYTLSGRGIAILRPLQSKPTSYGGVFLFGAAIGIARTPCIGPVLVAVLLLASTSTSVLQGGLLLLIYSLGISIPFLLLGLYLGKIDKNSRLWKVLRGREIHWRLFGLHGFVHTTALVTGLLFLGLGYLIFSGTLYSLNKAIVGSAFQKWMFRGEDWLLKIAR